MILLNPITISVVLMSVLCLLRMNVILSLLIAALLAGLLSNIGLAESMSIFIGGMGGNAQTALSYILLGALAAAINETGLATILSKKIASMIKGKGIILLILLALIAAASGTIIPVHIAFIPILIPPLLRVMNKLKLDRRAASCALALGLKAPYISIPIGYGLIFHTIVADNMTENGMPINNLDVYKTCWVLGIAMVIGFLIAILISYKKPREYQDDEEFHNGVSVSEEDVKMTAKHYVALVGAVSTLLVQLYFGSMPLGALTGLLIIILGRAVEWKKIDSLMFEGIKLMGFIAFVMLVASGYGAVMRATGGIDTLVTGATGLVGGSKFMAALVMLLIGLFITMGIGTSFGTVPILAVIYVPFALEVGFSVGATALLIATAAALGDAGSPASDTTLGPSAGLNADGQHDHIWDTCVPQFLHYNIPLVLMGLIGAMIF